MEEEILKFKEVTNEFDPIDFTIFKDETKEEFKNLCSEIFKEDKEKKALVISKQLLPKFSSLFNIKDLAKLHFSENFYFLESCPQKIKEYQIVFIIPSKIESVNLISKQIELDQEEINEKQKKFLENKDKIISKTYFYFHVPKVDLAVLNYISNNFNYYETFFEKYYDFELTNFVLDYDLISMEDEHSFKELFLYKFSDCVDNMANLLIKIQEIFGRIKYKYVLGENSKIIHELLFKKEKEGFLSEKNAPTSEILACFFLDRNLDYVTPMCSEFTYEAMLHRNFGISFNKMKVNNDIAKIKVKDDKDKKVIIKDNIATINLSYEDKLFHMIKSFNFDKLRKFLSRRLLYQEDLIKSMKSDNCTKKLDAEKIGKDVLLIKDMNSERPKLYMHINLANYLLSLNSEPRTKRRLQLEQTLLGGNKDIAEMLHDYYDTEMARKGDYVELMRLFCLENLYFGGVKGKIYESFKNDFLLTYGHKLFFLIKNLEELKILNKDGKSKYYQTLFEKLNLINFNIDLNNPKDTSAVFGGFAPLSIRLIENSIKKGLGTLYKEFLKNFGFEIIYPPDETQVGNPLQEKNFILLVFTGGVTYAEIDAVRFLNQSEEFSKYKFLIITTNIISAKSFLDEIKEDKIDLLENNINNKLNKKQDNIIINKEEDKKDKNEIVIENQDNKQNKKK